ncbi:hypothetical protein [Fodinicurvata sp. EGI_FJ10296]|uniref:hypothetical protein n=1 Tax=Fodinicurvata sp. EGI_FJ10296 TaxID=3231908 RepID=UPI00345725DC
MNEQRLIDETREYVFQLYTHRKTQFFLRDIFGQIEEDDELRDILSNPRRPDHYMSLTFDRRYKDKSFKYHRFDAILVILDRLSGGVGLYKPVNQIRALKWKNTEKDLSDTIMKLTKYNHGVKIRRVLVQPYPVPAAGHRIDRSIYTK